MAPSSSSIQTVFRPIDMNRVNLVTPTYRSNNRNDSRQSEPELISEIHRAVQNVRQSESELITEIHRAIRNVPPRNRDYEEDDGDR